MSEQPTDNVQMTTLPGDTSPAPATIVAERHMVVSGDGAPTLLALWRACHPQTWLLLIVPALMSLLALLLAGRRVTAGTFALALLVALCCLVGGSLLRASSASADENLLIPLPADLPPVKHLPQPLTRTYLLRAGGVCLGAAVVLALPLLASGGGTIAALVLTGVALAALYSQTRYALDNTLPGDLLLALATGPAVFLAELVVQHGDRVPHAAPLAAISAALTLAAILATRLSHAEAGQALPRLATLRLLTRWGTVAVLGLALALPFVLASRLAFPLHGPHGLLLCWGAFPGALLALTGMLRARSAAASRLAAVALYRACAAFAVLLFLGGLLTGIVHQAGILR